MGLLRSTEVASVETALVEPTSTSVPSAAARKRKAHEPEAPPSTAPHANIRKNKHPRLYRNHVTHWEEGDVYIRAGTTRFKLHKSRLARLSAWFREIFEQNSPEDGQSAIEVVLDKMDVSAEDFAALLDALDDSIKYTYTKPTFQEVASILRASTALSFEKFKPWARQYLENMWSPILDSVTTTRIPLATETIVLARRCSIPSVLKRALYELVRMKGFGQIYVVQDDKEDPQPAVTLSATDHLILTKAREKLGSRWIEIALSPPRNLSTATGVPTPIDIDQEVKLECPQDDSQILTPRPLCDNAHCTFASPENTHRIYRKLVHDSGIFALYIWDAICGVQALLEAPWADEGCCADCVDKIKGEWQKQKEQIWRDLDVWFGLNGTV